MGTLSFPRRSLFPLSGILGLRSQVSTRIRPQRRGHRLSGGSAELGTVSVMPTSPGDSVREDCIKRQDVPELCGPPGCGDLPQGWLMRLQSLTPASPNANEGTVSFKRQKPPSGKRGLCHQSVPSGKCSPNQPLTQFIIHTAISPNDNCQHCDTHKVKKKKKSQAYKRKHVISY